MGRYASGGRWRRPGRSSRPTRTPFIAFAPSTCAGWVRREPRPTATHSFPTTCASPTPYPDDDRPARLAAGHPPPHLRRPAAGRGDRTPRVPDAVVAGHVRARAVQAGRRLLGRVRGRGDARLPDLLALRHGLASHERVGRSG